MTAHMIAFQAAVPPVLVAVSETTLVAARSGAGFLQTDPVTATASGGNGGPYSYTWTRASGDTEVLATAAGAATTRFSADLGVGDTFSATFICTASDGSRSGVSVAVSATLTEIS